jgi:predicted DsbA family dithiol-disulfide isomerase
LFDLSSKACERIAAAVGLDLARYRRDASDPETRRLIDSDLGEARAAGVQSLPTVYSGHEAFVGAGARVDDLTAALRRAAAAS